MWPLTKPRSHWIKSTPVTLPVTFFSSYMNNGLISYSLIQVLIIPSVYLFICFSVPNRVNQSVWIRVSTVVFEWFGHVSRSAGLAKTILQRTVQGGRRRGWQKKHWKNNISERTRLKFCDALREADNKIKWTKRVARSMVP